MGRKCDCNCTCKYTLNPSCIRPLGRCCLSQRNRHTSPITRERSRKIEALIRYRHRTNAFACRGEHRVRNRRQNRWQREFAHVRW